MSKDEETREPLTRRLRALAFGGGAFDTIMQLGVVHALLVSRGKAPDHVVGVSAGAVNAAALAEILQSGESLQDPADRMAMQVRRLRSFLDAYFEFPQALLGSVLPDTFEVNAKQPLKPIELPIHFEQERKSRADATRSRDRASRTESDVASAGMLDQKRCRPSSLDEISAQSFSIDPGVENSVESTASFSNRVFSQPEGRRRADNNSMACDAFPRVTAATARSITPACALN